MSDTHNAITDATDEPAPVAAKGPVTEPGSATADAGGVATQDEPVLDQDPVSESDRIAGIVAQTRQDVGGDTLERIADVLRQRFSDSQMNVSNEQVLAAAEQVAAG